MKVLSGSSDPRDPVSARYSSAARRRDPALCCPVDYDRRFLEAIPPEVLERDYGCGDPSRHVRAGDTVLDLGSGGGKICFIAAQIVGADGDVIGIDANPDMLALARAAVPTFVQRIGFENVRFLRGQIQDLGLDLDALDAWLREHPVRTLDDLEDLERERARLRRERPLIPDATVDLVVSNCVLNLVRDADKARLIQEIHRVLRPGGRIAISDIVSDEPVPEHLKADPELWSGCVSGAFTEVGLLARLAEAGFYGIEIDQWRAEPFAVVEGIEFRSVTVTARKGEEGPRLDGGEAIIYRGPWRRVEDDEGHVLVRGERTAVCAKTFRRLRTEPYAGRTVPVSPRVPIPEWARRPYDCSRTGLRHPRETKSGGYAATRTAPRSGGGGCC